MKTQNELGGFSLFNAPISNTRALKVTDCYEVFKMVAGNQFALMTARARDAYEYGSFLQKCLIEPAGAESRREAQIRAALIKEVCNSYKNSFTDIKGNELPFVTFSVVCDKRKGENIKQFSGLICYDFDKIEDVNGCFLEIVNETYPELVFISPSGHGIKAIYRVDAPQVVSDITAFKAEFSRLYDDKYLELKSALPVEMINKIDPTSKDAVRACFLCHSKLTYINPVYVC